MCVALALGGCFHDSGEDLGSTVRGIGVERGIYVMGQDIETRSTYVWSEDMIPDVRSLVCVSDTA